MNNHAKPQKLRLVMARSPHRHGQHIGYGISLPISFSVDRARAGAAGFMADKVSQRRMLQNPGGRVPNVQKHFVERAVIGIAIDQNRQSDG
jgi:hypothetical protein